MSSRTGIFVASLRAERGGAIVTSIARVLAGLVILGIIPATLVNNMNHDADVRLAREAEAINEDGFKVVHMPKLFSRDILQDAAMANQASTVLDLGRCTVAVSASQETDPSTGLPDVMDYAFMTKGGTRVLVQTHDQLVQTLGPDPCTSIVGATQK